jgi:hypothetical protein
MALKIAIDLMHVPSQVRLLRSEPLPDGLLILLRIAAGDAEAERAAAALMDRSRTVVRQAATFFIEQILFAPNADSYQVLGASPQASAGELRRNVAILLRGLHPDLDPRGERSIFIGRVTAAWNDLKTPERRAAYDAVRRDKRVDSRSAAKGGRTPWRRGNKRPFPGQGAPSVYTKERGGFLRRALSVLFHMPQQ